MSTISTLPTAWSLLEAALRARQPIWVSYHGRRRLICPHALGWSSAAKTVVLGYQTGGDTSTGSLNTDPRKRWRAMFVDEIDHLHADTTSAWGTADNYDPSHPFSGIDQLAVAVTSTNPQPTDSTRSR